MMFAVKKLDSVELFDSCTMALSSRVPASEGSRSENDQEYDENKLFPVAGTLTVFSNQPKFLILSVTICHFNVAVSWSRFGGFFSTETTIRSAKICSAVAPVTVNMSLWASLHHEFGLTRERGEVRFDMDLQGNQ
jgi:hypothetical protein